ncbi:MAG TPA: lysozyme [Solirubrobacterales bacterium]|nr:lysozyme [Solirubrobacterales bacterium]
MRRAWSLLWAARFVAKWEGFVSHAMLDTIASPAVWTIGFGHTSMAGAPTVHPGDVWSRAFALKVLAKDLRNAARSVSEKTRGVKLSVRQRIALISGVFNCGSGILDDPDIMRPLRRGDWKEVGRQWEDWCHAGGVVVQGLLNRRRAEKWLMLHNGRKRRQVPVVHAHTRAHRPTRAKR